MISQLWIDLIDYVSIDFWEIKASVTISDRDEYILLLIEI